MQASLNTAMTLSGNKEGDKYVFGYLICYLRSIVTNDEGRIAEIESRTSMEKEHSTRRKLLSLAYRN